jgi:hypothetical protein
MKTKENILICKSPRFFCYKDEEAFFEWIKKIKAITNISGQGRELYLYLAEEMLNDQDLDDVIGLFYRYKIDMHQLSRFLTDENKEWFYDNKKAFWHKKVFKK